MFYYNECRFYAEKGLEELESFLEGERDLLYTKEIEKGCSKNGEDIICIEVEVLDDNEGTDFIGTFEFLENGTFIE